MNKAEYYRREAERLLSLAKSTSFAEVRRELILLADRYRLLARRLSSELRQMGQTG